jgi:hypothetical protein
MDAYDAFAEAMRRETCRFWGHFVQFFVFWDKPKDIWMCDLTEERNPNCMDG